MLSQSAETQHKSHTKKTLFAPSHLKPWSLDAPQMGPADAT